MFAKSNFGYTPVSSNMAGRKILEGNGDFDGKIIEMEDFLLDNGGFYINFDG